VTREEVELSSGLSMPIADGLDAVEEALALYRSSKGETKKQAARILRALKLTFSKLAPLTTSAGRWKELKREIVQEL
jgi:hypothetical protein